MVNKYYPKIKNKLEKEASERYQNLSEEEEQEEEKRQTKALDRYKNLSKRKKEKTHQYHRD